MHAEELERQNHSVFSKAVKLAACRQRGVHTTAVGPLPAAMTLGVINKVILEALGVLLRKEHTSSNVDEVQDPGRLRDTLSDEALP